jgi:hypothetical protein
MTHACIMPGDFIMRKKTTRKSKAKAAAPEEVEPERDVEELRADLTLKVVRLAGRYRWPACPRRQCRRQRFCAAVNYTCANPRPAAPMTPEQQAASMAHLRRALRREMARRGMEE